MKRGPDARERRAKALNMMPVATVRQRGGAAVDVEAHVPTRGIGSRNPASRDLISGRCQQNGETALVRHSHHADHQARRRCQQAGSTRRRACANLTKYGQPAHNALPFGARSNRPTSHQKPMRGAVVPHIARVQVAVAGIGITNAPIAISRLRV